MSLLDEVWKEFFDHGFDNETYNRIQTNCLKIAQEIDPRTTHVHVDIVPGAKEEDIYKAYKEAMKQIASGDYEIVESFHEDFDNPPFTGSKKMTVEEFIKSLDKDKESE
jgi:hypothetical protein